MYYLLTEKSIGFYFQKLYLIFFLVITSGGQPTSTTCLWASIISPWSKITPYDINNPIFGTIWRILTFSISWRSFTSEKSNRGSILWFTDRTYSRFDLRNITNYEYSISWEYSKMISSQSRKNGSSIYLQVSPCSHVLPLYRPEQKHSKPFSSRLISHFPPFLHGFGLQ